MKILSVDSSSVTASVAITENGKIVSEKFINNGLTHSQTLMPMVENVINESGVSVKDIDLFAITNGPGSFTGVRIGVALVKGIAFGKDLPCVSVSTLDALAENLRGLEGIIVPCMDARRSQVYTATYRCTSGNLEKLTEDRAIPLTELAADLGAYSGEKIYLTGDGYKGAKSALEQMGIAVENTPELLIAENAYSVAVTAKKKHDKGEVTSDLAIAPTYLRMPQAERERLERLNAENENER